ncbi:efflux RND transporter periplasmic adaptor subunit [Palleronia pontilimi]|uniref:efflux RND transporter periplasmic adaptor subunit n=1 Tax=Palleronia pontilimi TaxID=1964209 RepID=UPI001BE3E5E5|nr:efflux RND transporter periplasmic adaptor subunit [Palleronia pontilimi]
MREREADVKDKAPGDIAAILGMDARRAGRRVWVLLAVAALILAAIGWYLLGRAGSPQAVGYVTAPAARGDIVVTVTATGTVEPTNLVEISSELSGTLATVEVDFNDAVEVGDVLARLDTTKLDAQFQIAKASLDAAIARVAVAQASLDDAREKFEAARDLDQRGVTPHQAYTTQQATFRRAQAELQLAQADKSLAEANLDLYRAELDKACICSPIKGVVLDRSVDPGQIVAASLSAPVLFTVAEDLSEMELQVDVDEADIGRVAIGNAAEFTVDAYDERRFPAEVSEVRFASETIDGVVTYKTILTIDNARMLLRPGMTATADIVVAEVSDALVVPNAALRYAPQRAPEDDDARSGLLGMLIPDRADDAGRGNDRTLWVLRDGVAQEIPVRAGDSDGRVTEILEGPLTEGDRVITEQNGG